MPNNTPRYTPISCPFCKEADFDEIGLKMHLLKGQCDAFEAVENWVPKMKERT
jgi:hypothetical protein